jgi:hypothetical protein
MRKVTVEGMNTHAGLTGIQKCASDGLGISERGSSRRGKAGSEKE